MIISTHWTTLRQIISYHINWKCSALSYFCYRLLSRCHSLYSKKKKSYTSADIWNTSAWAVNTKELCSPSKSGQGCCKDLVLPASQMRQNPSLGLFFLYAYKQGLAQMQWSLTSTSGCRANATQTTFMMISLFLLSRLKYFPIKIYYWKGAVKLFFLFPTFCNIPKMHL